MIHFALKCANHHRFEGWFRSGADYEDQAAGGTLICPICEDRRIEKAIMAPAVAKGLAHGVEAGDAGQSEQAAQSEKPEAEAAKVPVAAASVPADPKTAAMLGLLRKIQQHVEKNFENVGERFASEARAIHDGDSEARGIYGQATIADARALHEDGIDVLPLPNLPKLDA